jgi:hypothetical protein
MSLEHDGSDAMGKAIKSIVILAVIGCITLSAAAFFLSQSMAILTAPEPQAAESTKH